jgi:hypothetical protein
MCVCDCHVPPAAPGQSRKPPRFLRLLSLAFIPLEFCSAPPRKQQGNLVEYSSQDMMVTRLKGS